MVAFILVNLRKTISIIFSTANHTDEYVLHNLLPNMWYAVHYEYMRTSPFHIYDEQRFIVESPDENGTSAEHPPAYLQFSPNSFYSPSGKIDHSLLPSVQIVRDSYYKGKRMLIIVEAPCDNDDNDTEIWLSDAQPTTRLHVDLEEVICVHGPRPFCDQYYMHNEAMPHCETSICYTTQVLIDNEFYEAEQVCEDVIEHYPSSSHFCSYLNFLQLMLAFYGAARFISWKIATFFLTYRKSAILCVEWEILHVDGAQRSWSNRNEHPQPTVTINFGRCVRSVVGYASLDAENLACAFEAHVNVAK